jgi:MFS family permease
MDYQRQSNGLLTFLEHWWLLSIAVIALVASQVLSFFTSLTGMSWVWCYGIGVAVSIVGVVLIFYAKLPLYRQLRFFTFGSAALPEERRSFYRWGYRCVFFAVVLLLCLFLSRP